MKTEKSEKAGAETGDDAESAGGSSRQLDSLACVPVLRRRERHSTGEPPKRYSFGRAYIWLHKNDDNPVLVQYKDGLHEVNAENWIETLNDELDPLQKLHTLELV